MSAPVSFTTVASSISRETDSGQRLHAHILNNPVGREIFGTAKVIDGDVHALSMLPYHS
jgi:hypothetical protein